MYHYYEYINFMEGKSLTERQKILDNIENIYEYDKQDPSNDLAEYFFTIRKTLLPNLKYILDSFDKKQKISEKEEKCRKKIKELSISYNYIKQHLFSNKIGINFSDALDCIRYTMKTKNNPEHFYNSFSDPKNLQAIVNVLDSITELKPLLDISLNKEVFNGTTTAITNHWLMEDRDFLRSVERLHTSIRECPQNYLDIKRVNDIMQNYMNENDIVIKQQSLDEVAADMAYLEEFNKIKQTSEQDTRPSDAEKAQIQAQAKEEEQRKAEQLAQQQAYEAQKQLEEQEKERMEAKAEELAQQNQLQQRQMFINPNQVQQGQLNDEQFPLMNWNYMQQHQSSQTKMNINQVQQHDQFNLLQKRKRQQQAYEAQKLNNQQQQMFNTKQVPQGKNQIDQDFFPLVQDTGGDGTMYNTHHCFFTKEDDKLVIKPNKPSLFDDDNSLDDDDNVQYGEEEGVEENATQKKKNKNEQNSAQENLGGNVNNSNEEEKAKQPGTGYSPPGSPKNRKSFSQQQKQNQKNTSFHPFLG